MLTAVLIVAQQLTFTPYHANGMYELHERVGWNVGVAPGQTAAGTYTYTVKRDGLALIGSGALDLSSGHATIVTSLDQPGMLLVEVRPPAGTTGFHGASKAEVGRVLLGAAVAPRQIRPSDPRPPDFEAFWAAELRRLDSIPLDVEPHDVPANMPQAFYDALPQLIKNYRLIGRHSRDESYFLLMYLGDYRAAGYLASRADWNGKTLVVMGTSMGGQQGFALAGLDTLVTALIAHVPAGCDLLGPLHGRAAPYPNWDVERPEVGRTAAYFDAVNFAPRIRARALVSMGFIDETSPPAGIWAAFNQLPGPKEAVPMVESPHNHLATPVEMLLYEERSTAWLDELARGGHR